MKDLPVCWGLPAITNKTGKAKTKWYFLENEVIQEPVSGEFIPGSHSENLSAFNLDIQ